MSKKVGFLGRFQPFHQGHYQVVENYKDEFNEFCLVIGSADKSRTDDNPLTFEERKKLIKSCFPDIEVLKLEDTEKTEEGNKEWVETLQDLNLDAVMSRNSLVKEIVSDHTDLEVLEQKYFDKEIYSGSEVRRRINSGEEWRYLTPKCSHDLLEDFLEIVKKSGTQYNFEPGWERKNAFHDTE